MESQDERLGMTEDTPKRGPGRRPRQAVHSQDFADERETDERGYDEREAQERELSDDDFLEMFRDGLHQSVLPDLPVQPGYHVCWLSTTNPRDTVARRMQVGYELIRADDLPGYNGTSMKSAEFPGVISVNEMVAARIKLPLYNRYMRLVHHSLPLEEEKKLKSQIASLRNAAQSEGADIIEGDGTAGIVQGARPPEYAQ